MQISKVDLLCKFSDMRHCTIFWWYKAKIKLLTFEHKIKAIMGISGSKETDEDEDAKFVQDPALIFWDEFGNLRYGIFSNLEIRILSLILSFTGKAHPVKQEKQIRAIMELDHIDDTVRFFYRICFFNTKTLFRIGWDKNLVCRGICMDCILVGICTL